MGDGLKLYFHGPGRPALEGELNVKLAPQFLG